MKILHLSPLSPIVAIAPYMRTRLDFVPFSEAHQGEMGRHVTMTLPSFEELVIQVNGLLLVPRFYEHCLNRIQSGGRYAAGSPQIAIARKIVAANPALIKSVKERLATEAADPAFSREMMKLLATWRNLMRVVRMAYPEVDALAPEALDELFDEEKPNARISLSDYLGRADGVWETAEFFSGGMNAKIQSFGPDLVFLTGSCPVNLPFFVAAAKKIKGVNKNALIFLRHGGGLLNANSHYKEWFLENAGLFDLIDGVIMYTDVADLTCYEIVRNLSAGGEFRGIGNLACRHEGRVVFSEPDRETVDEYLRETKLVLPPNFSYRTPKTQPDILLPAPQVAMVNITATRQACYWYKCNFCDINRQNFVLRDPHLSRRGEEVSRLLLDLRGNDIDFAFVEVAAVPPVVLKDLVKNFDGETGLIPWGYEARFDPVLTPEFAKRLRKAGCIGAIFGLETAVDRVNKLMNKYPDEMNVASIEKIIDAFDQNNMMVHVNTIGNLPGMSEMEFQQHARWLHANLDRHRLFRFNTNHFLLRRGAPIAKRPGDFGIELKSDCGVREDFDHLPFTRLSETPQVSSGDSEIYNECLGYDRIWGISIHVMHGVYHERLTLSFFDAMHGQNLLKWLQTRLGEVSRVREMRVRLPESVVVGDVKGDGFVTLTEMRDTGTSSVISREMWSVVEKLLKSDASVGPALDALFPEDDREGKARVLELVKGLVADGLLL